MACQKVCKQGRDDIIVKVNRRFSADVTRMRKFDYYSADHTLGGSHTFLMYCGLWGKPNYECISASNSACKIAT